MRGGTDDDGTFEFEGMPSEIYRVTVAGMGTQLAYPSDVMGSRNFEQADSGDVEFVGGNKKFACKGDKNPSTLCAGGAVWGTTMDAVRQDHRLGVIWEEFAANDSVSVDSLAAPGHQALGFGMVANRKIKTKVWKYAKQDTLDSSRTKHEGSIQFKARKCGSVGKHATATGEECGDSGLYTMNAANSSDAGILRNASNPTDSLAALKRYFGADKSSSLEYIAKSGDSFWLEFDGHDAVIELAPGRYVLRQSGAQKDKTEKFEIKWDKGDGSCDPANNHIWSLSDPAKNSLPSTTVIIVPHDRTKKVWGRSQEDDRSNRTYGCKPIIHSEPLRISYVPVG